MRFGVLGAVAVGSGGVLGPVRWPMPRSLLAVLLLNANRVVSAGRLVEVLWGDDPPTTAMASLHNHVMRLRSLLAGGEKEAQIRTLAPGYVLEVADSDVDLRKFTQLSRRGRDALAVGDWDTASRDLNAALGLWRGEPLEDVTSWLLREREVPRLIQMRLEAVEARIEADLHRGGHEQLISELGELTVAYPLRERFHAQLMQACYQTGRQAEALAFYQRAREVLAEELGLDPGPDLQQLYQQILTGERRPAALARCAVTVRPAQLPADLGDLTGRADQVRLLTTRSGSAGGQPGVVPVCVVTGPGGIGKTSLAVHAAHEVSDRFPDGQLYASLGGTSARPAQPGQVLGRFLRDLGADPAHIPAGVSERATMFRSLLSGRRVLILLDDARNSTHVAMLIPGTAGSAVIVTSRNPLTELQRACRVPLAAFSKIQSIELLTRIIGSARVQAEVQAAETVVELCAGLPLALRIVGSRLVTRPHWTIADLAERLAEPTTRLDELAVGDLSVRATLTASYTNLRSGSGPITPARAFRLLGLWTGPDISTPAAAALFGVDLSAAEHVLETLMDGHLLQAAGTAGRYRLRDLLGIYAAERAREEESPAEIQAAIGRLLAWYLHSVMAPDQAVRWLRTELPNLHTAAQVAAAHHDHETAGKLAAALGVC